MENSINNLLMKMRSDTLGLYQEIFELNMYNVEKEEIEGKTIIDIGANSGYFSVFASLNGAKKVYSYEPAEIYSNLIKNTSLFHNIVPIKSAITKPGQENGVLVYTQPNNILCTQFCPRLSADGSGEPVACLSLEEAIKNISDTDIVIKIDCEGSEYDILLNAPDHIIRRFKYIYAEFHNEMHDNKAYNYDMLESFIVSKGYSSVYKKVNAAVGEWRYDANGNSTFVPYPQQENPSLKLFKFVRNDIAQNITEKRKKYSVIIPTYNHLDDCLKPCLESIIKNTTLDDSIEIIVVANGCTDGTVKYVESLGKSFRLLVYPQPMGYTKSVNCGLKIATGEYIVLLNNDCVILDWAVNQWLDILNEPFKNSDTGITGVLKKTHENTNIDFLLFFCTMIKREVVQKLGLLDEAFNPGYGEDIDYCKKATEAGYKIVQVPDDTIKIGVNGVQGYNYPLWHKSSQTVHQVPNWDNIVKRNEKILSDRYSKKKYSIVIPTYNHLDDCLKPCIDSIIRHTDMSDVEVIVVANGCTDGTKEYVESLGNSFKLIWIDEAVGYIKATNKGIDLASGTYVILLNNDSIIMGSNWLELLEKPHLDDSSTGITGPHKSWIPEIEREYILFFCAMIKKSLFEQIGKLDERFGKGYLEDVEFSTRIEKANKKLVQVPFDIHFSPTKTYREPGIDQFPIYHAGGRTFTDDIEQRAILMENNLLLLRSLLGSEIDSNYERCRINGSDINEHLPTLNKYAKECSHITEFGVRNVVSTWAFVAARPKKMISYDIEPCPVEKVKELCKLENIEYLFNIGDTRLIDIEQTDLLFIDTYHSYDQLNAELNRHASKVNKYIIMHDTNTFGRTSQGGDGKGLVFDYSTPKGLMDSVEEFVQNNKEWKIKEVFDNCNGLTVLERCNTLPDGFFGDEDIALYRSLMKDLPNGAKIAEIGVWQGRSLCSIADIIKEKNISVIAVDTFEGSLTEPENMAMAKQLQIRGKFLDNVKKFGIAEHIFVRDMASLDAASFTEDASLDVIFIDADHSYEAVRADIDAWLPKLKPGGIIAGHDYPYAYGVAKAVDETFGKSVKSDLRCWYVKTEAKRSKIYDCFPFFNELDLLEIRLNELYDTVDKFVLVEANYTHQGDKKPLYFQENKERFSKFLDKIEHIVIDEFPPLDPDFHRNPDPEINAIWFRESYQRSAIKNGLKNCSPDDIIILTDADEIPRASAVKSYKTEMGLTCLKMRLFYFKLNYETVEWFKARMFPYSLAANCRIDEFRTERDYDYTHNIENGGWHFSFLGDKESVKYKISSWAHKELNTPEINNDKNITEAIENARDVFNRGIPFNIVPIDETYPLFIRENIAYYDSKGLIKRNRGKIYDCFMFFNELDLLEIRLNELYDVVDHFVIVESPVTFSGQPKSMNFEYNRNRFARFLDKIIYVKADIAVSDHCWNNESLQRNYIATALKACSDEDIIILSDIDEIPRSEAVSAYSPSQGICSLSQKLYYYYLNCYSDTEWAMGKIATYGNIKNLTITDVRVLQNVSKIPNAGWHFSYTGGPLSVKQKIQAFSHQEFNTEEFTNEKYLTEVINNGKDLFKRGTQFTFVNIDSSYPKCVTNNVEYYKSMGLIYEKKSKVYDCFTFYNELDLLEIRLNELDPYVDRFVLAEMEVTHTNFPKPLYFQENKERFKKFLHKIEHIIVKDYPDHPDPWYRERYQRDYMMKYLIQVCQDDDIIIISDVDEIPRGNKISQYTTSKDYMYFEQKLYNFYYNMYMGIDVPDVGVFSKITTFKYMKDHVLTLNTLRYCPINDSHKIQDGGWHFSWIGGAEKLIEKLRSYGHQEVLDRWILDGKLPIESKQSSFVPTKEQISYVENAIASGNIIGREQYKEREIVNVDETFPEFLQNNKEIFYQKGLLIRNKSKIAIVMPYYNEAQLLKRSVNAIVNQTYQDWELFIIDDGSTVENKASNVLGNLDSRVKITEKTNGGVSSARNLALSIIRKNQSYEYIAYCDADDVWSPNYLSSQLDNIQDCDFVYSDVIPVFADGTSAFRIGIPNPDEYPGLEFMLKEPFIYVSSVLHRRKCLDVGDFNSKLNSIEDWDMWVRMAKAGYKFKKNRQVNIQYTVKDNGMAAKNNTEIQKEFVRIHPEAVPKTGIQNQEQEKPDVTAYISTKNRYFTTLPIAISAIANQTYPVKKLVIFDDAEQKDRKDLRNEAPYRELFSLLSTKGIEWYVFFGEGKGQVLNHQKILSWEGATEWLWRVDDDDLPEPNCLEILVKNITPEVGAVGGSVLTPSNLSMNPDICSGKINDIYTYGNVQWAIFPEPIEVDHLHNTFLYRKQASRHGYCMELSPVGHREETIFTYEMKRAGWKLIVDSSAKTWHMRDPNGGIRSYESQSLWDKDEAIFKTKMNNWGMSDKHKNSLIVLNSGLGDHYAFKHILPEIKAKYGPELRLAVCFPEVFEDDGVKLISIADAEVLDKDQDKYNVYKWAWDHNWQKPLTEAFRGLYL